MIEDSSLLQLKLYEERSLAWEEATKEIESWFDLMNTLRKEYDEKFNWALKNQQAAMARREAENKRLTALINEIDDKHKEGTAVSQQETA